MMSTQDKKPVDLRPGILSNEIFERIVGVMLGYGITEDEIDYAFEGVYVYGTGLYLEQDAFDVLERPLAQARIEVKK